MSMDTCKSCCRPVDTDMDTDCYEGDSCICERCRENGTDFFALFTGIVKAHDETILGRDA